MCQLMQYFSLPQYARVTLQSWQNSDAAIGLKRDVDSIVDFCGYLYWIGGQRYKNSQSMKMFGLSLESIMRESAHHNLKRPTKLEMHGSECLPKCDDLIAIRLTRTCGCRFFAAMLHQR